MSDWARWINTGRAFGAETAIQAAKGAGTWAAASIRTQASASRPGESAAAAQTPDTRSLEQGLRRVDATAHVVAVGKVAAVSPEPAAASTVGVQPRVPLPAPDEASELNWTSSGAPTVPCHYTASRVHTICLARGCIYHGPHCHHCGAPTT